jgi:Ca-activated chloride channel homolog
MRGRTWMIGVFGALMLVAAKSAPVVAQGWVEPTRPAGGFAVSRTRTEVRVLVEGRVAQVEVDEWFVNRGTRVAEGHYLYPLPGEAVFQGFSLYQGDAELRGEILDAEEARGIYEAIVRRRADPALIELAGHGLLRARVFPIEPGQKRRVTLRYTQLLERAGNALQFTYAGGVRGTDKRVPLDAPVGRPMAEPAGSSFRIDVDDPDRFLDPFSPTHALRVDRAAGKLAVSLDEEIYGQLSVFLPLAGEPLALSVATHRPVGEAGYFMLTLSPELTAEAAEPRDVTVVMDVSGSMSGEKIEQARQALRQLLGSFDGEDRFRLISFSNVVRMQSESWTEVSRSTLAEARRWVDALVADGGTNIEGALSEAFRLESLPDRLPVVLFLTDGLPSVGERRPERLADFAEGRAGRARVFAFGVGPDVNTHLLDRLGEAGRGTTQYVQPGEDVERAVSLLATRIRHPVLTELELSCGPTRITEVYPVRIPDVFAGQELVLFGRFEGEGQGQMTVEGQSRGRVLNFSTRLRFPKASEANGYIPRLWASRKLGHLERQIWTEGETSSLIEEIRGVALRYGLPSRYTSYLVQEPNVVAVRPGGTVPPGGSPVMPALAMRARADGAARASGAFAVRRAEEARKMRAATSVADLREVEEAMVTDLASPSGVRVVAGRRFQLRDGAWEEVRVDDSAPTVRVRPFSPAYFGLLLAIPELQPIFRAMTSVKVAGRAVNLAVGGDGIESLSDGRLRELAVSFREGGGGA